MSFSKHKRLIVFLAVMLVSASAGLTGHFLAQNEPRIVPDAEETQEDVPADAANARIARGATVTWQLSYGMCGHRTTLTVPADESMIGLGFTEFAKAYPDVRILSFAPGKIELKRSFACYCPDHFILKKHGERLAIFKTAPGTGKLDVYAEIPLVFGDIEKSERPALETGRVFGSFDDLEAFVETLRDQ